MADYGQIQWSGGKPYIVDASGKRYFLPPIVAAQYRDDPKALAWAASQGASIGAPGGTDTVTGQPDATLLKTRGTWNPDTGQYDQGVNWENLASLAAGGFVGAGAGAALAGGAGGGAAAAPAASSGGGAAIPAGVVPAATAGTLPSTVIGTGAIGPIAGGASGAVPAALGASAGGAAAAAGSSLWSKLAAPLISGGASVAQGLISANAAKSAAEQQKEATMAALDLQKQIWQQQQTNLAPYMGLGPGAISNLQGLTGTRPASQVFGGK